MPEDNPLNVHEVKLPVITVELPNESVKVYVYGAEPPKMVTCILPEVLLHTELVILTDVTESPPGVNSEVDDVKLHNPASVTCTVNTPEDNPVKVYVVAKLTATVPLEPE